jgi:hypothetical protein
MLLNGMSELVFFRFMSLSLLSLEEQQHKDEIVSLTEQVLYAKGIECDSKVAKTEMVGAIELNFEFL